MSKTMEQIRDILKKVEIDAPAVEGLALVSWEGLMISSALHSNVDESLVAAMASTLQGLGEQAVVEFQRGKMEAVFVRGKEGYILIGGVGKTGVLMVLARPDAKLGVLIYALQKASKQLLKLL